MSTENSMTIADGLNELKRIEKVVLKKQANISRYCSKRRGQKDEIDEQKKFVKETGQSVRDLLQRHKTIKLAINRSNLDTMVHFEGKDLSIAEAILFKQKYYVLTNAYHNSFHHNNGRNQIQNFVNTLGIRSGSVIDAELAEKFDLVPELYYDEKSLIKSKEDHLSLYSYIDTLIEKSNHKTFIGVA